MVRNFNVLTGCRLDFYGAVDGKFKLGTQIWEAQQNDCDGWRSSLGQVVWLPDDRTIFEQEPLARVRVEEVSRDYWQRTEQDAVVNVDSGYRLVDVEDGHVWLVFGTDREDDWYPCYVFVFTPKGVDR